MPITGPLAGRMDLVAQTYDCAIGYTDPVSGNTFMYGYTLTPGSTFTEATDLQDEEHLVQVASPLSTDRYGRFPKVSQGDFSGGERQLIYETANQYYSSTQLDTSKPGHLRNIGAYTLIILPHAPNTTAIGPRLIAADGNYSYVLDYTHGAVYLIDHNSLAVTTVTIPIHAYEIIRGGDAMYFLLNGSGVYQLTDLQAVVEVTNDAGSAGSLAYFAGSIWYALQSPKFQLNQATYPFPGAAPGNQVTDFPQMEVDIVSASNSATGLVVVTNDTSNPGGSGTYSYIYTFDGVNQNFIGRIEGQAMDTVEVNGTVYVLCQTGFGNFSSGSVSALPTIYEVVGTVISVFDDFRLVDTAFQPPLGSATGPTGHLASDGIYLYLFWQGLRTKRYLISTGAVYDVGSPNISPNIGTPTINGGWVEENNTSARMWAVQPLLPPVTGQNGVMQTSFYDFGTPNVQKSFKSVEFTLNTPLNAQAIQASFILDNLSNSFAPLTVQVSPSGNSLIAYFPARTIGFRVALQLTFPGHQAADMAGLTVLATLARTWTFTVGCRRQQSSNDPSDQNDPQAATAQQLIANIMNAYFLCAGNITLWIPDATVPNSPGAPGGMVQVNAQIQDYNRTSTAQAGAGGRRNAAGDYDFDADILLTITEQL